MIVFSYYKNKSIIAAIFLISLAISLFSVYASSQEASTKPSTIVCGNNIKEAGEQCDGSDLGGQTCLGLGYAGGVLACYPSCTFNVSNCVSGGGGGGGGGAPVQTTVIFLGRAYPKSNVTLLKDAQIAASTIAGTDANFQISLSGLSAGNYIFSVYSEDKNGNRSTLLTFPVSVTAGATTTVSGIFIAPTISVDKEEVKKGDNIAIFGQSAPRAEIIIQVSSEQEFFAKTTTDNDGVYLYNFGTEVLDYGSHLTKSKSAKEGEISSFSKVVSFLVGTKNVLAKPLGKCGKADLNCDGRVNLVDFSIAAYWYQRTISAEFALKEKECLNGDGKIDLVDFSIMAFYWTG